MKRLNKLKIRIKRNEGFSNKTYLDQLGHTTIGYGHLVKKNDKIAANKKYSECFLSELFETDFKKSLDDFNSQYKKLNFPKHTQEVLLEMIFQLGIARVKKFVKFNKFLISGKVYLAALEMLDSVWYLQTPRRVRCLVRVLLKQGR